MFSPIDNVPDLQVFITVSVFITFPVNFRNLINCVEIPAHVEDTSSNLTEAFEDVSRIDRSRHDTNIENKFFIKSNTIIRTGESRDLGAKYLNETRLSSNHECLMWCLETPTCNAAVYEEKNMQSCYMFDCGSPAKPLCKFTAHIFFTSSVLKMSQHSYELSQWGRQVKQERGHKNPILSTTPLSTMVNTIPSKPSPPINNEQPGKKGNNCHHYQFQCVNSSECIAIYNVCDGIPQCPDGSDESPELKCPNKDIPQKVLTSENKVVNVKPTLENKPVVKQNPALKQGPSSIHPYMGVQSGQTYKKPPEHKEILHKDYKGMWPGPYSGSLMPKTVPQYHHRVEDSDGLGSPFVHKHSQFISANDPHVQNLNHWASDYDQYPPHSTSLEQQYNSPYDRIDEQYLTNQMAPDYDTGKSYAGYHRDDIPYWSNQDVAQDNSYTADEFPQPGVQNLNKVIGYPDKESAYRQQVGRTDEQYPESKMSVHSKTLLNPSQPSDVEDYTLQRYPPHSRQQQPYMTLEDSLPSQRYSNYPEMKAKVFSPLQNVDDTLYNNDDLIRASIVNQLPRKIDQIRLPQEHNLKHLNKDMLLHPVSKEKYAIESTSKDDSLIIVKPTLPSKSIQKTVLDFKMSVAELYQSSSTHTHEANSAIVALVLGIAVSFFLVVLLACRMKTLRRRMSRKGRGLAHDADYLVNGMYL